LFVIDDDDGDRPFRVAFLIAPGQDKTRQKQKEKQKQLFHFYIPFLYYKCNMKIGNIKMKYICLFSYPGETRCVSGKSSGSASLYSQSFPPGGSGILISSALRLLGQLRPCT
jgi:hypothetical protein